jgi:membrane associated rhomboid family serine protease
MPYLLSIAPLALAQLSIPPLFYIQGRDTVPDIVKPVLLLLYSNWDPRLMKNEGWLIEMMIKGKSTKKLRSENLTHMFVHMDYDHLFNNVISMITWGQSVYFHCNTLALYTVFLGGGIYASTSDADDVLDEVISASEGRQKSLLTKIVEPAKQLVKRVKTVFGLEYSCGSSGGVCALMGCSFVFNTRDILRSFQHTSYSKSSSFKNLVFLTFAIAGQAYVLNYIWEEFEEVRDNSNWTSSRSWLNWLSPSRKNIGHRAHVNGFGFGLAFGLTGMALGV